MTPTPAAWAFVPCPLCGNADGFLDIRVTRRDHHIANYGSLYQGRTRSEWKICAVCGFVHQNPRPTADALNQFYLAARYRGESAAPDAQNYRKFAHWYFAEKADFCTSHTGLTKGAVFDVGCGYGGALAVFQDRGWRCLGMEADRHCGDFARRQLGLTEVVDGLLTATAEPKASVDLIFSNHAFEHIADLDEAMRGVVALLKPNGYVFTAVPTYYMNRSTLSKQWMNSSHYSLFTHRSLNQLFARHGFEPVAHTYRGWRKEIDEVWHLARFTGRRCDPIALYENAAYVDRYLRWVNPLRSALFFPLFGYHSERRQAMQNAATAFGILRRSPRDFVNRLARRLRGAPRSS